MGDLPSLIDAEHLIEGEEGFRAVAYDDATGEPIVKGYTVQGHVTVGYGFKLDGSAGLSKAECESILWDRLIKVRDGIVAEHPWFRGLSVNRQDVLVSIAYNAGEKGLDGFHRMLGAAQAGDWEKAAAQIVDSELPENRKKELSALMLEG